MQRHDLFRAHNAFDAVLAARLARFTQIEEDSQRAIDAVTGLVRRAHYAKQPCPFEGANRYGLMQPLVIPARSHIEDSSHCLDRVFSRVCFDEFIGTLGAWIS